MESGQSLFEAALRLVDSSHPGMSQSKIALPAPRWNGRLRRGAGRSRGFHEKRPSLFEATLRLVDIANFGMRDGEFAPPAGIGGID